MVQLGGGVKADFHLDVLSGSEDLVGLDKAFATALEDGPVDSALDALPRPRIVFVGAVSAIKVDLVLLGELAELRPEWSIVLVGPVGLGDPGTDVSGLAVEANVHLLGHRKPSELPSRHRQAPTGRGRSPAC